MNNCDDEVLSDINALFQQANVSALFQQAASRFQQGHLDEAEIRAQKVLKTNPTHADSNHLLGLIAYQRGQFDIANQYLSHAIKSNPDISIYYNTHALVLQRLGHVEEALSACKRVIELNPQSASAYNNYGFILNELDRAGEALAACERAIELNPQSAEAYNNRASSLRALGQTEDALVSCERAIELNPGYYVEAQSNRGVILRDLGRLEEALAIHDHQIKLNPQSAKAYSSRGSVLLDMGRLKEAMIACEQAIKLRPDFAEAHYKLAWIMLLTGDYRNGFREHEWRWKVKGFSSPKRNFNPTQWDGSSLSGKTILLHAEQGAGDNINFIRYVPLVAQAGGRVIVECQKELLRLFFNLPGIDLLVERGEALPDFDVHAPLMSLPYILKTTLDTIPSGSPYLFPARLSSTMYDKAGFDKEKRNIGIVWAGNPVQKNDRNRSTELTFFSTLMDIPGINWISLQVGDRVADLKTEKGFEGVIDASPYLADFSDTASVIKDLDLVISVDTSVAHLAGALGAPIWVLLSFIPDWRYMLKREDSLWYPSMRLFRQPTPGDWTSVFAHVRRALDV